MASLTRWTWVWASSESWWWTGKPGALQSMGLNRVRHDWATSLSLFTFMHWRRKWQLIPVFLPGNPRDRGSVTQLCPTLCDPMNHSTPGLPVHHHLPESTQTHVHRVSDAIQPSHPLSSPSPPAPNPSQHQGLFQWVNSSHEVAMDWLDLLAVQGTLKSLLQHHSSKASILRHSGFFLCKELKFSLCLLQWVSPECTGMRTPIAHSWGKKGSMKYIRFSTSLGRKRIEKLIW